MTLRPLVVVAIVLGLASCAQMNPRDTHSPRASGVEVFEYKYIVVVQEPIVFHGADIVLIWRVDASQTWRFPQSNAIVFPDGAAVFRCNTNGNGTQVQCVDRGTGGKYKDNITLPRGSDTLKLDPFVWNL